MPINFAASLFFFLLLFFRGDERWCRELQGTCFHSIWQHTAQRYEHGGNTHPTLIQHTLLFLSGFLLVATAAELKFTSFREFSVLCSQVKFTFALLVSVSPVCLHLLASIGKGRPFLRAPPGPNALVNLLYQFQVGNCNPDILVSKCQHVFGDWVWWITRKLNHQTFNKSSGQCRLF